MMVITMYVTINVRFFSSSKKDNALAIIKSTIRTATTIIEFIIMMDKSNMGGKIVYPYPKFGVTLTHYFSSNKLRLPQNFNCGSRTIIQTVTTTKHSIIIPQQNITRLGPAGLTGTDAFRIVVKAGVRSNTFASANCTCCFS